MNSVMISIQPKWCNLILAGAKTREVRKTKPAGAKLGKLDKPFKCFIYCTGVKRLPLAEYCEIHRLSGGAVDNWHGKVIAEFICDGIYPIHYTMDGLADAVDCNTSCLKPSDFITYGKGKPLYGWKITKLKIYDSPKELSDFCFPPELYCEKEKCGGCPYDEVSNEYGEYSFDCEWERPITRPPQSWCFAEEASRKKGVAQ